MDRYVSVASIKKRRGSQPGLDKVICDLYQSSTSVNHAMKILSLESEDTSIRCTGK